MSDVLGYGRFGARETEPEPSGVAGRVEAELVTISSQDWGHVARERFVVISV
jgi:hypothetical protein